MFYMARSYSRLVPIDADDVLTALKIAANYEAELYEDNHLIFSPFGFSREENTRRLLEYGITTYVSNNRYCYKYTDESKNKPVYFARFVEYDWSGKPHLQVHVHDYKSSKEDIKYDSIEAILEDVKQKYSHLPIEAISVGLYDDNGYTSLKLQ